MVRRRYQRLFDVLRGDAQRYVDERATELRGRDLTVDAVVAIGAVPDAIADEAQAHPGSLLVLSTHGRTGWRAVALGSVARRLVLVVGAPVLIVRPVPPMTSDGA